MEGPYNSDVKISPCLVAPVQANVPHSVRCQTYWIPGVSKPLVDSLFPGSILRGTPQQPYFSTNLLNSFLDSLKAVKQDFLNGTLFLDNLHSSDRTPPSVLFESSKWLPLSLTSDYLSLSPPSLQLQVRFNSCIVHHASKTPTNCLAWTSPMTELEQKLETTTFRLFSSILSRLIISGVVTGLHILCNGVDFKSARSNGVRS